MIQPIQNRGEYLSKKIYFCTDPKIGYAQEPSNAMHAFRVAIIAGKIEIFISELKALYFWCKVFSKDQIVSLTPKKAV